MVENFIDMKRTHIQIERAHPVQKKKKELKKNLKIQSPLVSFHAVAGWVLRSTFRVLFKSLYYSLVGRMRTLA